jgi:GH25 family lysozyme M1 (1,4-beta-N-acetylmuramidase)
MRQNKMEGNHKKCIAFRKKRCAFEGQKVVMYSNEVGRARCAVRGT